MTVFSKSAASRQDNDTAFPAMIEWATATNRAIAPMEFPDALDVLVVDLNIRYALILPYKLLDRLFPLGLHIRAGPRHSLLLVGEKLGDRRFQRPAGQLGGADNEGHTFLTVSPVCNFEPVRTYPIMIFVVV